MMEYKGYPANIGFDADANIFNGKVINFSGLGSVI
jgi:predicted HicB family RNase H-like nuclease